MDDTQKSTEEIGPPLEIPYETLSPEALDGVIESFVQREGTDYGRQEISLDTKLEQLHRPLEKGDIKIVYDPSSESVTVMTIGDWKRAQKKHTDRLMNSRA